MKVGNNPDIFNGHIIDLMKSTELKKLMSYFSKKQLKEHGIWLDKFAFYKIGTLLGSSPITDPIKAWQTNCLVKKLIIIIKNRF